MKTITATEARKNIYQRIQDVEREHEPIFIKNNGAVIISQSDWHAIQET